MSTAILTETDLKLRDAVMRELEWAPEVDASAIGVAARAGAVTLSGFIDSYAGKLAAERAAKRVRGVRAVANEVQVRRRIARADDEIARDAAAALGAWVEHHPGIQASVRAGHVTLTGAVAWLFHRIWAEEAMHHVPGVVTVTNRVVVLPESSSKDVEHRIRAALHRLADLNARDLTVTVKETAATIRGTVTSWAQRDAVERAASSAPGITHVENLVEVAPSPIRVGPDEEC